MQAPMLLANFLPMKLESFFPLSFTEVFCNFNMSHSVIDLSSLWTVWNSHVCCITPQTNESGDEMIFQLTWCLVTLPPLLNRA